MYPNWLQVEYATIFLISFWTKATEAAKIAVIIPTIVTKFKAVSEYSNSGEHLTTKNTPAVTIVAAWINAETGVGPSIASGNQVCKRNWADLPIAPINKNIQIKVIKDDSKPKNTNLFSMNFGAVSKTSWKFIVPKYKKIRKIPIAKPKSPTLLTINALIAALFALSFLYQNPINK